MVYPYSGLYPSVDTIPGSDSEEVDVATFDESILTETKKSLGIEENVEVFDQEIRMHINAALGTLNQLGIGPEGGFEVETAEQQWDDFLSNDLQLHPVKTYVHLRVRLLYDPPATSWVVVAMKEQIAELEWRLNVVREDKIPLEDPELPEEDEDFVLDGGVI